MWPYHYPNYYSYSYPIRNNPYQAYEQQPFYNYSINDQRQLYLTRQQSVRGQATWTVGGKVTKCGIPWSEDEYLTAAVGENSPYKCGQALKIRNLDSPEPMEIIVTVVDTVPGYPANKINLHRRAFVALGAKPSVGVINIEITPSPELEEEKWGKYLLEVTKMAYPSYNITDYNFVSRKPVSPTQTRETYEFILQSQQDNIKVQGNVVYNPRTDRVISIDLKEVEHFRGFQPPFLYV